MLSPLLQRIVKHTDVLVALGVITILGVMIIPLPTYMMDFLLTLNISLALLVLMLTIYIARPLELSVFPGLLLVLTLFRLSLNVASTRLILSQADAGSLIAAFGDVVVRGNYILGFIIFVIVAGIIVACTNIITSMSIIISITIISTIIIIITTTVIVHCSIFANVYVSCTYV